MNKWIEKNKYLYLCLLFVIVVIISPVIVNWMIKISCDWTAKEPNSWIGFWGAYLGAVGSFLMALIAYITLSKNNEQLKYIKEQSRPYLFVSLRVILNNNTRNYYLLVENLGVGLAQDIHLHVSCKNAEIASSQIILNHINGINNSIFSLPSKASKYFLLYSTTCGNKFKELDAEQQKKDYDFYKNLEDASFLVKINHSWDYSEYKHEETLYMNESILEKTKIVQMLNNINNSINQLSSIVGEYLNGVSHNINN